MRNKTVGILELYYLYLHFLVIIADKFENDFSNKSEYGRYIAMLGGAFIGVGFFARRKKEKSNEFSY
jgi:hypothetical protein